MRDGRRECKAKRSEWASLGFLARIPSTKRWILAISAAAQRMARKKSRKGRPRQIMQKDCPRAWHVKGGDTEKCLTSFDSGLANDQNNPPDGRVKIPFTRSLSQLIDPADYGNSHKLCPKYMCIC